MDKNPNPEPKDVPREKRWERTNKNKKFLKKPNNKTAKKQFFKELRQNSVVSVPQFDMIDGKILNDLETCTKIFEVADLSKQLDLEVLTVLSKTLCRVGPIGDNAVVEMFFEYARHGFLKLFVKICIKLRERALAGEVMPTYMLCDFLWFFDCNAMFKRGKKLLRNTENFEVICQPQFLEPIFFNSIQIELSVVALDFLVIFSKSKFFTKDFVRKYVIRIRKMLPKMRENTIKIVQSISQKILENEHRVFFLKLVSEMPLEQIPKIIAEDPQKIKFLKTTRYIALMKCASCEKKEKSAKEFKKCNRCNLVYYCSKNCQRTDWPSHKQICK